jgi:hypothetical protein
MKSDKMRWIITPAALAMFGLALVATPGCEERTTTEEAADSVTDAMGDAADSVNDAAENAADAAGDAAEDAADAAEDATN